MARYTIISIEEKISGAAIDNHAFLNPEKYGSMQDFSMYRLKLASQLADHNDRSQKDVGQYDTVGKQFFVSNLPEQQKPNGLEILSASELLYLERNLGIGIDVERGASIRDIISSMECGGSK
jgi:hypothetical protein